MEGLSFLFRIFSTLNSPFDALEEHALLLVAMLISMDDVPLVLEYPIGNLGDQAPLVGPGE